MANCKGQKFGHNFPFSGADCLECEVNQKELSDHFRPVRKMVDNKVDNKKGMATIHTRVQLLAKDISEHFAEPKRFGTYAAIIKRIGIDRAYQIFSEIKQSRNVKNPARLFMYKTSKKVINSTG